MDKKELSKKKIECERCDFYIILENSVECLLTGEKKELYESCSKGKERTGNHLSM